MAPDDRLKSVGFDVDLHALSLTANAGFGERKITGRNKNRQLPHLPAGAAKSFHCNLLTPRQSDDQNNALAFS
jgi:hypothetical protein